MTALNAWVGALAAPVFAVLGAWPPWAALALFALAAAVLVLLAFRWTSNPERIEAAQRGIKAGFLEIRLLNDDLPAILRAQASILRHNGAYLRASALPVLLTLGPIVLAVAQLQSLYGYRDVRPGDPVLLVVRMAADAPTAAAAASPRPALGLDVPPGLADETGPVWLPAAGECVHRLRARSPGVHRVVVHANGATAVKDVVVATPGARKSPQRRRPDFVAQLLYPVEPPLPDDSPIASVRVEYAPAHVALLGHDWPWMVPFFVFVTAFALLLRRRFGVRL